MPSPRGFSEEARLKSLEVRQAKAADRWSKYLRGLERGLRIGQALEGAGLSYNALYDKRKKDPTFKDLEAAAEAAACDPVEDALREAALGGNVQAAQRWLEQRSKDRWTPPKKEIELTQTLELEAGARMERIVALIARLEERQALNPGMPVIDVEVEDE